MEFVGLLVGKQTEAVHTHVHFVTGEVQLLPKYVNGKNQKFSKRLNGLQKIKFHTLIAVMQTLEFFKKEILELQKN